jgi:tape measure domain-containing protein
MNGAEVLITFKGDTKDIDSKAKNVTASVGDIAKGNLIATGITKAFGAAWNVVSRNMDKAIDRYDTIQNFPKVMKNFGVSADEASESVNRIADSVLGLPTSLDQAVAGVQDIFMVTKDLKKAEAMFQAVNDSAMVFANGSTQAVDLFIYAYKQAMAAGKVSAQDFNQMNQAIPGVMDKVAESMGVTFGELKEGLSKGDISLDQFNNTLQKLDTEGVGAMGAMRDAAFDATGGIRTAITNMNSRISAGLAEMIDAVNKGLKKAGLGNLATVFSNVGTSIKNVLTSLAPYIVKIITFLANLFNWINKNKTLIGAVIVPILAIIAAVKTWSIITGAVTKAMALLNAVMAMNPISLIILAIVALVAAFVYLWNNCEGFRNFWIGLWEGLKQKFDIFVAFIKLAWDGLKIVFHVVAGVIKSVVDTIVKKFNSFKKSVKNVVDSVVGFFKSLPGKMLSIGLDIVKGIGKGITSGISWIKNKIKSFVGNVTGFIKKMFKIGSPSKLMANEIGQWIPKGIGVGITANTDAVNKSMSNMQKEMMSTFQVSPQLANSAALHYSPTVVNNVQVNMMQDPLGQMVRDVKTFSGGSKNDYNYGMGV